MAGKQYQMQFALGAKIQSTFNSTFNNAKKSMGDLGKKAKDAEKGAKSAGDAFAGMAKKIAGIATAYVSFNSVKNFIGDSISAAMGFESAMADVVKVVDTLKAPDEYAKMSKELLDMTRILPMTSEELARITAAAGQAGIVPEDLTKFTETAAKMGIAFDVTADQAGQYMATWRTALGMTQDEVTALADQMNYLSNNGSESAVKLSDVVTRIGSLGKISGVSGAQISALAASMTGVTSEISATGIKNMMSAMNAGSSATKKQTEVLNKLGFSATGMAKRMQTDAQGAILDLLAAFQKLPKAEQNANLTQYFGKESVSAIAPLLSNLDNLKKNFDMVSDATQYAGSMEGEFASRAATTENKVQLARNALSALQISLGNLALPLVAKGAGFLSDKLILLTEKFEKIKPRVIAFGENIKQAFDNFSQKASGAFNKVKPHLVGFMSKGWEMFEVFQSKIKDLQPSFNNLGRLFVIAKDALADIGNAVLKAFKGQNTDAVGGFSSFLDIAIDKINWLTGAAVKASEFIKKHWGSIKPLLIGVVAGFAAFKAISFGTGIVKQVSDIASGAKMLSGAFGTAQKVFLTAQKGVGALIKLVAANPILLIAIAIGVAVFLIIKHWDKIKPMVEKTVKAVMKVLTPVIAWFKATFTPLFKWLQNAFSGAVTKVKEVWGVIAPYVSSFLAVVKVVISTYIKIYVAIFKAAIKVIGTVISIIVTVFKTVLKVVATVISTFVNVATGIFKLAIKVIGAVIHVLVGIFKAVFTIIAAVVGVYIQIWIAIFKSAFALIGSIIARLVDICKDVWTGISNIFANMAAWFGSAFGKAVEAIQAAFSGVGNFFTSLFDGVWNTVRGFINLAIRGINAIIKGFSSLKFDIPDWVPLVGGNSFGINIPQIPMLAKGGIATGPTLAMIGEGREKEAVLPLSKLDGMLNNRPQPASLGTFKLEIKPTVIIRGNADENDVKNGIKNGIDEAMSST